jgi:ATP-dependent RNA helicase RhlB
VDAQFAADAAADSAAFGDKVIARDGDKAGGGRGHGPAGRSGERPPRTRRPAESRPPREARPPRDATEAAVAEAAAGVVAAPAAPVAAPATEGMAPAKRRRRGGRGRHREGGPANGAAPAGEHAAANAERAGNRPPSGERRPLRERPATDAASPRPSRQVNVTAGHVGEHAAPSKPGFFRRLGRLFTGR